MPWLVVFWIVPPVQVEAVEVQVPPLPVTASPAVAPVLFRTVPLAPPLAAMLAEGGPPAPMLVLPTFGAGPGVVGEAVRGPGAVDVEGGGAAGGAEARAAGGGDAERAAREVDRGAAVVRERHAVVALGRQRDRRPGEGDRAGVAVVDQDAAGRGAAAGDHAR